MTLAAWQILVVCASPWLLGAGILQWLGIRRADAPFAYAGWSCVLGSLAIGALYFAWLALRLPLLAYAYVPAALAAGAGLSALRGARTVAGPRAPEPARWLWIALASLLVAVVAYDALDADGSLVVVGDEANIWSGKAKAIFAAGGFTPELRPLLAPNAYVFHPDYPLWNPLLQLWTFALAGGITHVDNRLPIQMIWIALPLLVIGAMPRGRGFAAAICIALFALSSVAIEMTRLAAADGMVAASLVASVDAWRRYDASGEPRWRRLWLLAMAALVWAKNEGAMLALCVALGIVIERIASSRPRARLGRADGAAALPLAAIVAGQAAFNRACALHNDIFATGPHGGFAYRVRVHLVERLPVILDALWHYAVVAIGETNGVFVLGTLAIVLFLPVARRAARLEVAILAAAFCAMVLIYAGTPRDLDWHLKWSVGRILMQVAPVLVLAIARIETALRERA